MQDNTTPSAIKIGVIMGSDSDWPTLQAAAKLLEEFGVAYEARVVSAHRTPKLLCEYAETARARGLKAIIAGAGGAAHLPGMIAAMTPVPVLGVPVQSRALSGLDSLLSIVRCRAASRSPPNRLSVNSSVNTIPGATSVTRIGSPFSSSRSACTSIASPAFAAL